GAHPHLEVEIAGRPTVHAGAALAGEADLAAIRDPRRDADLEPDAAVRALDHDVPLRAADHVGEVDLDPRAHVLAGLGPVAPPPRLAPGAEDVAEDVPEEIAEVEALGAEALEGRARRPSVSASPLAEGGGLGRIPPDARRVPAE